MTDYKLQNNFIVIILLSRYMSLLTETEVLIGNDLKPKPCHIDQVTPTALWQSGGLRFACKDRYM